MLQLVSDNSSVIDPLRYCVERVLEYHHRRTDLVALTSEMPGAGKRWTRTLLPAVAERLDCSLKIVKTSEASVRATRTPVILPLQHDDYLLVLPAVEGVVEVVRPGQPIETLNQSHLKNWCTGEAFVLLPKQARTETSTSHMHSDQPIDWFWQPILKYTGNFFEVVVCTIFINLLVIALPLFTLNVYDAVVPNLAMSTLSVLALGVCIAIVFDIVLKTVRSTTLERIAAKTGSQFDNTLMQRMLAIQEEQMQLSIGERCNLFRELQGLRDFYATRFVPALVDFPFFLVFLLIIYLISPLLALVPLAIAVAILVLNASIQIPVKRRTKELFAATQEKSSMMVEMLTGSIALKQLNATGSTLNRWSIASERAAEESRRNQRWASLAQHGSLGLMQLNHVLIVVVGVYQIKNASLTIGGLVAATILASRTIAPIMNLHSVIARWTQSRDCLKSIDELFSRSLDRSDSRISFDTIPRGEIAVRNVSYQYPQQSSPALNTVSLSIKPGEKVCLIGPSGAGKSTLARAIAGALVPAQGRIVLDGYDYQRLTAAKLRASVALIPQNPFFIKGTVRENVLLGVNHCSEKRLNRAASLSGLNLVLESTGSGLDTETGEGGKHLSGGQKQALSIARAIVRNTRVLVFDEPTNGLDAALEQHFLRTMKEFTRNRTLILVTHRMSLLSLVSRVIVLDKGTIVADDAPEAVMKQFSA